MRQKNCQRFGRASTELIAATLLITLLCGCSIFRPSRKEELRQQSFAYEFYRESRYYRAVIEYRRLAKRYPDSPARPKYLFQVAESYYLLNKHLLAINEYQKITHQYPESPYASLSMQRVASCYFLLGAYSRGIQWYKKNAERYPDSRWADDALYYAANIYHYQLKNDEAANKLYQTVMIRYADSDSADDALRSLMWYYLKKKNDPAAAIRLCRGIITRSPQSKLAPLAQFRIAKIFSQYLKDTQKSLRELTVFSKRYPDSMIMDDVLWEMAMIYEKNNQLDDALDIFSQLIESYTYSHYRERAQARMESIWRTMRRRNTP